MILSIQHKHNHKKQETKFQNTSSPTHQAQSPQFLKQILSQSEKQLSAKSTNQISQLKKYRQKKIYQTLAPTETNYLAVMFQKANPSEQSYIKQLMSSKQNSILQRIVGSQIQIKQQQKNQKKIKRIKNELDQKIKQMKKQLGDFAKGNQQQQKQQILRIKMNRSLVQLEDFKKKQYWNDKTFNEEGKRVKSFLSKMKKQKSELEGKFNQDLYNRQKRISQTQMSQKQKFQLQKNKNYMQNLQKQYKKKANQRKKYFTQKQQKSKQIQTFLQSLKTKQPIHIKFQKDFKDFEAKQQQQRQKLLKQIKQKHPHFNPQEIQEHMNNYDEKKQKYIGQKQIKAEMEEEILSKRYQEIRQLYHSKFHQKIISNKKVQEISYEELVQNRKKVMQYANTVKESFKPLIDKRKKKQVSETIRMLELSQDPTKRKIIKGNGIIDFQDKKQNDSYQKGVSYLDQLRTYNEMNKSRVSTSKRYQQRSNSALQLSASTTKKIDYLRESRPSLELKPTISDWKNLLVKKQFSKRDKLQRVLDRAQSLQIHAKQKQVQLRNMKKQQNVLDIKQQSDKYYLQSVAARMVLLKDYVMK